MFERVARALIFLSRRSDLVVASLMLVAIVMIIIPLPTWLVDGLIAVNISLSMLVLLVVFYIARPVEFSSFPSVRSTMACRPGTSFSCISEVHKES